MFLADREKWRSAEWQSATVEVLICFAIIIAVDELKKEKHGI